MALIVACSIGLAIGSDSKPPRQSANQPVIRGRLDDMATDVVAVLRGLPGVVEVTRYGPPDRPSQRIIHLLDWHFVPKDMYAADIRSLATEPITDAEIDQAWKELVSEVGAVQEEQIAILSRLTEHHGLERIYIEGLTPRDVPIFKAKITGLRKIRAELADLRQMLARDKAGRLDGGLKEIEERFQRDLLQIGAGGRLLMDGRIREVRPLEDATAYEAADPVATDGTVVLDEKRIEARQDAQAKRLLDGGRFALIILGGAHDLSDNLDRVGGGKVEYIRVATGEWRECAENVVGATSAEGH